jgi:hypothetical protein
MSLIGNTALSSFSGFQTARDCPNGIALNGTLSIAFWVEMPAAN